MSLQKSDVVYQTIYSHQLYLNSGTADIYLNNTNKSNVAFFFEDTYKADKNTVEIRISIVNAEFPKSWYLINDTNNKILITLNNMTNSYYFPKGNYNISTFISMWITTFGSTWTLTYSSTTNIITFGYSVGSFSFSDDVNSIFPIIGLKKGSVYTSSANKIYAPFSFNFSGITRLNIKSSTFNLKNSDSTNGGRCRTIASIPVNGSSNGIVFYNNISHYKSIIKNKELSSITIEIQDDYKNFINFNNIDWTITLQIDLINEIHETLDTLEDIYKLHLENV